MSANVIRFTSGECVVGYILGESTAEEADAIANVAYRTAGIDPDDDEDGFVDFKYDVVEARLIEDIRGAIDNAVNDFWLRARSGEFTDILKEEA